MKYDYHNHTVYCKHADITVDDLVKEYVERGMVEVGLSDHVPYEGALDSRDNSRMFLSEMELYFKDIEEAKKHYGSKIKIWTGFESEYFPTQHKWYEKLLKMEKVDYLILGIHAVEDLEPKNNYNKGCTTARELQRYWNAINEGMRTGLFAYAVHPDFFMKSYETWDADCEELANKICDLAVELDFPLGFNINGFWKGPRLIGKTVRNKYPIEEFWKIAKSKGVKIILESDTHHKKQLYDKEIIPKTYDLLKSWEIDDLLIEKIDIKSYKKKVANLLETK